MDADAVILGNESVKVLLEQDVLGGDVGEDEIDLGLVTSLAAADDGTDDLQHRGDTSATGNHTKVADHVGSVDKGALGATDADRLADLERRHVLGDVTGRVRLDEQVEEAGLVVARDGSVRADNLLGAAVFLRNGGADRDVLADGKAKDGLGRGKLEAVAM